MAADQWTKRLIVAGFAPGDSWPVWPPIVSLTYVQNTGAAFGMFKGQQSVFVAFSCAVIGWIAWEFLTKPQSMSLTTWGSALILGGAVGNLIDRLRLRYVIDFLDLHVWPVFNLGDSAITIGVALLLIHAFCVPRDSR